MAGGCKFEARVCECLQIVREKMEKRCEFCRALRPIVYCKADAAHLCLSCDAKIHSANTVFNRHHRTVLCDSCRCHPAYVHCLDHRMFLCNACDRSQQHCVSSSQRRAIRSYIGCPSAKEFAALWGFQLNELKNKGLAQFGKGSNSQQYKMCHEGEDEHKNSSFILQQILELGKLQLAEGNSLSVDYTWNRFDENLDPDLQLSETTGTNFEQEPSLLEDLKVDPLPFSLSQPENLPSNPTIELPLQTESIWQCRSPVQSSQVWSQDMQDLGVCEELVSGDDLNIPDVDLTFRNFEELFGGDQDPTRVLPNDNNLSFSSVERDMSLDKSDNSNPRVMVDALEASSMYLNEPADMDKDTGACSKLGSVLASIDSDSPCPIQPPSSTSSITALRFSTVSSVALCHDTQSSSSSPEVDVSHLKSGASSRVRYKEKKHSRPIEKKVPYPSRKSTVDRCMQMRKGPIR